MRKLFFLFSLLFALFSLPGCVNRQLAESYSLFLDTAGAEYIQYVDADPALTEEDRAIRHTNYDEAKITAEKFINTKWSW